MNHGKFRSNYLGAAVLMIETLHAASLYKADCVCEFAGSSHHVWRLDSQNRECPHQLTSNHGSCCQEEGLASYVFFREYVMPVVEVVEQLAELKCVLRQIGRLGG